MSKEFKIVIPVRYDSSRFPGKAMADINGKPMIQWVYEAADNSRASRTIVATDNDEIRDCVNAFGGNAVRILHLWAIFGWLRIRCLRCTV